MQHSSKHEPDPRGSHQTGTKVCASRAPGATLLALLATCGVLGAASGCEGSSSTADPSPTPEAGTFDVQAPPTSPLDAAPPERPSDAAADAPPDAADSGLVTYASCLAALQMNATAVSGVYKIDPDGAVVWSRILEATHG